jgi:hypothetical protein
MSFVAKTIFTTGTFRNGDEKVATFCFAYIKEVSTAFASTNPFGKYAFFRFPIAAFAPFARVTALTKSTFVTVKAASVATTIAELTATPLTIEATPVATPIPIVIRPIAIPKIPISPFKIPVFHLSRLFCENIKVEQLPAKVDFPFKQVQRFGIKSIAYTPLSQQ